MANWIKGAIKNRGGLHAALGVPQNKKIGQAKIQAAAKAKGRLGKMGRLALTLGKIRGHSLSSFGPKKKGK